jgi:hypothetical protein
MGLHGLLRDSFTFFDEDDVRISQESQTKQKKNKLRGP